MKKTNNCSVYGYTGESGTLEYVGMTCRAPQVRWSEHTSTGRLPAGGFFEVLAEGLSQAVARSLESTAIGTCKDLGGCCQNRTSR